MSEDDLRNKPKEKFTKDDKLNLLAIGAVCGLIFVYLMMFTPIMEVFHTIVFMIYGTPFFVCGLQTFSLTYFALLNGSYNIAGQLPYIFTGIVLVLVFLIGSIKKSKYELMWIGFLLIGLIFLLYCCSINLWIEGIIF